MQQILRAPRAHPMLGLTLMLALGLVLVLAAGPARAERVITQDGQYDPLSQEPFFRPWPADIDWLDVRHRTGVLTVRIAYHSDSGEYSGFTRTFVDTRRDRNGPEFEVRLTVRKTATSTTTAMKVFRLAPLPTGAPWIPPRSVSGPGIACSGMTASVAGPSGDRSDLRVVHVPRRCLGSPGLLRVGVLTQGSDPEEPSRFEDYAPGGRNEFTGEGTFDWTKWLRRG